MGLLCVSRAKLGLSPVTVWLCPLEVLSLRIGWWGLGCWVWREDGAPLTQSQSLSTPSWAMGTLDHAGHLVPRPCAVPASPLEGVGSGCASLF